MTGAGSGIGRAIALELDRLNYRIALVGRDSSKLEATRGAMSRGGQMAMIESCDVADRPAVQGVVARVLAEGRSMSSCATRGPTSVGEASRPSPPRIGT
ncbi:MAG: SDR family oxidoreductase [Singulisphaera sp.]